MICAVMQKGLSKANCWKYRQIPFLFTDGHFLDCHFLLEKCFYKPVGT